MKLIGWLNPQKWLGQILLLVFFAATFFMGGAYYGQKNCPPQHVVNNGKVKVKGQNNKLTNEVSISDNNDCDNYIKSLSNKELKAIRKK